MLLLPEFEERRHNLLGCECEFAAQSMGSEFDVKIQQKFSSGDTV